MHCTNSLTFLTGRGNGRKWAAALAGLLLLACTSGLTAEPQRAGWTEPVSFLDLKVKLPAKLDTGAKTSAIGGYDQERFVLDGAQWIGFTLTTPDGTTARIERPIVRSVKIKRAGVEPETRPVVALLICVAGMTQETQFTVTDRRTMAYPVLLGRRFLAGQIVVDPGAQNLTKGSCGG